MTAALETTADVLETLQFVFRKATLRSILFERFGLDDKKIAEGLLIEAGFSSLDDVIQQKIPDMERLRELVLRNVEAILVAAAA